MAIGFSNTGRVFQLKYMLLQYSFYRLMISLKLTFVLGIIGTYVEWRNTGDIALYLFNQLFLPVVSGSLIALVVNLVMWPQTSKQQLKQTIVHSLR